MENAFGEEYSSQCEEEQIGKNDVPSFTVYIRNILWDVAMRELQAEVLQQFSQLMFVDPCI